MNTATNLREQPKVCKRRVLVVEDDPDIRGTIQELLEIEGYETLAARDGAEALLMLEGQDETGLILLDLMMPGMNGWEFLAARKRKASIAPLPVIVLSAVADENVKQAGAIDYIRKPVSIDKLLQVVKDYCG